MRLPILQTDTVVEIEQSEMEYKTCKHAQSLLPQFAGSNTFSVLLTAWQSPPSCLLAIFAGTWEFNVLLPEFKVGFASTRVKAASGSCTSDEQGVCTHELLLLHAGTWTVQGDG
jgi:hypothetical protein